MPITGVRPWARVDRSEEHTSELQSPCNLVCRLLLEKKKKTNIISAIRSLQKHTLTAIQHTYRIYRFFNENDNKRSNTHTSVTSTEHKNMKSLQSIALQITSCCSLILLTHLILRQVVAFSISGSVSYICTSVLCNLKYFSMCGSIISRYF